MKQNALVYNLYGLHVHSEINLPAPLAPSDLPPYDLHVCWGEGRAIADDAPAGEILAHRVFDNGQGYTLIDNGSGYIYRFYQIGEFWMDRDLRSVRVHLAPHVQPEFAALLVVGNVMACVLTLGGEPVLHASAVEMGGSALAFLGNSGAGKSSLAALLCANGARLVTDDLLRLQPDGENWRCYAGTGELRLRQSATAIVESFSTTMLGTTADERISVKADVDGSMPPLAAIIIPQLSRDCGTLKVERIPPARSLLYLMAYPRMIDTVRGNRLQGRLDFWGRIAARVPFFEAQIPWGSPLSAPQVSAFIQCVERHGNATACVPEQSL